MVKELKQTRNQNNERSGWPPETKQLRATAARERHLSGCRALSECRIGSARGRVLLSGN
jgi:hypothetical protein